MKTIGKEIWKEQLDYVMCRVCKKDRETVVHIKCGCSVLLRTEYKAQWNVDKYTPVAWQRGVWSDYLPLLAKDSPRDSFKIEKKMGDISWIRNVPRNTRRR